MINENKLNKEYIRFCLCSRCGLAPAFHSQWFIQCTFLILQSKFFVMMLSFELILLNVIVICWFCQVLSRKTTYFIMSVKSVIMKFCCFLVWFIFACFANGSWFTKTKLKPKTEFWFIDSLCCFQICVVLGYDDINADRSTSSAELYNLHVSLILNIHINSNLLLFTNLFTPSLNFCQTCLSLCYWNSRLKHVWQHLSCVVATSMVKFQKARASGWGF